MSKSNININDWQECPHGTLHQLAKQNRTRKVRIQVIRKGSLVLLIALVSASGYFWLGSGSSKGGPISTQGEPNYGGIACSQVKIKAIPYLANQLDAITSKKIREHLEKCPLCTGHLERMRLGITSRALERSYLVTMRNPLWDRIPME